MTLLDGLDYASVLVFALTGALAASRSQLDIVGFIFIACLTAVGGGTIRDTILNREVFWVADPVVLAVASLAAVLVFFTAHLLESRYRALLWFDAFALAVAVPAGVAVALAEGQGVEGIRVDDMAGFNAALASAMAQRGPRLIEVACLVA